MKKTLIPVALLIACAVSTESFAQNKKSTTNTTKTEEAIDKAADKTEEAVTKAVEKTEKGVMKAADAVEKETMKAAEVIEKEALKAADKVEKALEGDKKKSDSQPKED